MTKNILVLLSVMGLTACSSSDNDMQKQALEAEQETTYNSCLEKGVKYYTDLGSYPTLSTGESAEDKIKQKCDFSTSVFD